MKLKGITLKNFQGHAEQTVEFSPGITTIVGPTDAGKSAILRALRWACLNDFAGSDFVREGTKRTEVTLQTADGARILRSKSKDGAHNAYMLDEKEFKAFGQGVPADIAQALQLSDINFQGQHDAPFWFSETAGEVSRRLNAVIDLSIIDTALSAVGAKVRLANDRVGLTEERILKFKTQLAEAEKQADRVEEFKALKETNERFIKHAENYSELEELLEAVRGNQAGTLAQQAAAGGAVLAAMLEARRAQKQAGALADLLNDIAESQAAAKAPPTFTPVQEAYDVWWKAQDQCAALDAILFSADTARKRAVARSEEQVLTINKFKQSTKGALCPLCGNRLQ